MEFCERKPNRIPEYDYGTNGAYFVTICTQDRKKILSNIVGDDAHIVPKTYGMIAEKYIRNVPEIEKYVIMPDHIHMIIRLDNGSMWASTPTDCQPQHNRISNIVRSIKVLVAKEIGESIFQRSYYDHVIRNQQDYNEIWQYIENNPRKWVIQKQGFTS
ncbi:MAG: transposase [Oscillospiraceae bacterium]|nr:transposase [Oscillospiraceae bacterium]